MACGRQPPALRSPRIAPVGRIRSSGSRPCPSHRLGPASPDPTRGTPHRLRPGSRLAILASKPCQPTLSLVVTVSEQLLVKTFSGTALGAYVRELAQLRIQVFRAFPYLYDGDLDYESRYLQTYLRSPRGVIVLVFDGSRIVGASTGLPLADETPNVAMPFVDRGYNPSEIFYFGESVLLPQYRGQGLGVRFFEEREAHARRLEQFRWTAFCAVDRPEDHPRRPPDYTPLDRFWENRGYHREPHLKAVFSWRDLDDATETEKPMTFWMHRL